MKTHILLSLTRVALVVAMSSLVETSLAKPYQENWRNRFAWDNLVSDISGVARRTDANLVNPWALVISPTGAIWVADNGTGTATVYDWQGRALPQETNPLVVTIPAAPTNTEGGKPTGQVYNPTADFVISQGGHSGKALFLFAGEDGTISGWNPSVDATHGVLGADQSSTGAIYKGLALGVSGGNSYLFATNFHAGTVDIFNKTFALVVKPGAFHDPTLPAGFAPFGIQNIQNLLFVTYAKQDADAHDDVSGAGNGFIDIFDLSGNFVRRFATQGRLNSPWGLARGPRKFGKFENALLVGNFGDGRINAFNFTTGTLLAPLKDEDDHPLAFDGLWGLTFFGDCLFFTAGIAHEDHGLFGVIYTANGHDGN